MSQRLKKQLEFLIEIDKMKTVFRKNLLTDGSRRENDAEHSWHFAITAVILAEYADKEVDISKVIKMALIHDLIEIYAGDTFAYDEKGYETKAAREEEAAKKLFSILPSDQGEELSALWREFENEQTKEAKYAAAIDRLQPFINNYLTKGHTWKEGNVTSGQVYKRMDLVKRNVPAVWPFVVDAINDSIEKGWLKP